MRFKVDHDDAAWSYDNVEEFLADYRKYNGYAYAVLDGAVVNLDITAYKWQSTVSMKAPLRADIEAFFDVFEKNVEACKLPVVPSPPAAAAKPVIFIGHGRSGLWRELKDHLQDKHGVSVEAYESGARAGHTIRDILEDMASKSTFALLVLTGEDEQSDGTLRARQNVIHEAGLFQGRLGFARAIVILEEGVEDFSNMHGVQYIKFAKGNIKETFGEILATLRREFPT
jgi:predicted nucleotide-binding protein